MLAPARRAYILPFHTEFPCAEALALCIGVLYAAANFASYCTPVTARPTGSGYQDMPVLPLRLRREKIPFSTFQLAPPRHSVYQCES